MADNLQDKGAADRARINLTEDFEVKYWTRKFGITAAQLQQAAEKAGSNSVAEIEKALGRRQ
jgi:hypothetical protein